MEQDMRTLLFLRRGEYTDNYGYTHDCMLIVERLDVTPTGENHEYQYYTETMHDPIYQSEDGRRFIRHVPTDWGCTSTWTEEGVARITDTTWCELLPHYKGKPFYYANMPVIEQQGEDK
jgi:hypothetical protein